MTRENLQKILAFATLEELQHHKLTLHNIKRYVLPQLQKYRITKNEKITDYDILKALIIISTVMTQKPSEFRTGRGDVWTALRKEAIMSCELPVE